MSIPGHTIGTRLLEQKFFVLQVINKTRVVFIYDCYLCSAENQLNISRFLDQEIFPRTENFPKISLFKTSKFFRRKICVGQNHILQNFLSAENFPEWKWTLINHFQIPRF